MNHYLEAFRENLADEIERREIVLQTMADDLGMSRAGLSRVIHGHDGITIDRAGRIADYIGVPLARLLKIREKVC